MDLGLVWTRAMNDGHFPNSVFHYSGDRREGKYKLNTVQCWGESVTCKIMSLDKGIDVSAASFQYLPRHHILSFFGDK